MGCSAPRKLAFSASMKPKVIRGGFSRTNGVHPPHPSCAKKAAVGSSGQGNGSVEGISRRLEAKRFPGSGIEPQGNLIKVVLSVSR
jgi:hypothetical protein